MIASFEAPNDENDGSVRRIGSNDKKEVVYSIRDLPVSMRERAVVRIAKTPTWSRDLSKRNESQKQLLLSNGAPQERHLKKPSRRDHPPTVNLESNVLFRLALQEL